MDTTYVRVLLVRVKRQERNAVGELYTYILPIFHSTLRAQGMGHDDASDVSQIAAIKLISGIVSYDPAQDNGGWVWRVLRNATTDFQRDHKVQFVSNDAVPEMIDPHPDHDPILSAEGNDARRELRELALKLPNDLREALIKPRKSRGPQSSKRKEALRQLRELYQQRNQDP